MVAYGKCKRGLSPNAEGNHVNCGILCSLSLHSRQQTPCYKAPFKNRAILFHQTLGR